ncbi:sensor histidine kinase [Niabella ginsengisoli]|uniref:histidine kinase n=1 Tax=Niabella ginsengisoli TaxID=522298 RepID=A0ABS9SDP2_9BACT|nr:HAMP domain-containing sensor histidine kinase [Niabella ginsengisoli]MCH5596458.1 HAMP domain-containing histidine kinase [Niabella ginsengisoli]
MAFEKEKEHYEDKIDFFTNVAHEIKTPLTLIKGPMENIMDEVPESSPITKNLQLMSRNADRLMHLANQILDFRKIEMNGFHLNFDRINISELLNDIYLRFKPIAAHNILSYEISCESDIFAQADEEALNKIFNNLIDNAVKYAQSFVTITLTLSEDQDHYKITFANDGFVIPEEDREKIFDSFYRIKDTSGQSGTGIGLALSRTLAEMHNGKLYIDPMQNDKNVFVLLLPLMPKN